MACDFVMNFNVLILISFVLSIYVAHVAAQVVLFEPEKLLLRAKFKVYEQGDRSGKLLAYQIHKIEASQLIPAIRGGGYSRSGEINNSFKEFYCSLYSLAPT